MIIMRSFETQKMEIKLKKGRVNQLYNGLGFDLFKEQIIETKVLKFKSAGPMKENQLPQEPETVSEWESRVETIKKRRIK